MHRRARPALVGLIGVLALSGCGGAVAAPPSPTTTTSSRDVQVSATFATAPGIAVTYDPQLVGSGARVAVSSTSKDGNTSIMLAVRGLLPSRGYGAHAHTKPCGAKGEDAGPHFQHDPDPVTPSVDPTFANAQNEIWLDLTTDPTGAGSAMATVAWEFPADRRPHSVIIHAMPTATDAGKAGTAGNRAACVNVEF